MPTEQVHSTVATGREDPMRYNLLFMFLKLWEYMLWFKCRFPNNEMFITFGIKNNLLEHTD